MVGTVKKSMETIWVRWFSRKVRQVCDGGLWLRTMYLLTLLSPMSMPSLSSSPWIRGAPHKGFSRHILRIRFRTSRGTVGLPRWPRRIFQVQKSRKPLRCHARTVPGRTIASTERQSLQTRDRQTQKRRSTGVNLGRFLVERCSTPSWWRRARFSSSRAARERKIKHKLNRSFVSEMSIGGENYQRSIIPVRSDISRFSRGTVSRQLEYR